MDNIVPVPFDCETTARGPDNNPEAQYRDNILVMVGWIADDGDVKTHNDFGYFIKYLQSILDNGDTPMLVAHNLKFDLKYLLRYAPKFPWNKCEYFCTMTAQYLWSGHKDKFISLEALCDKFSVLFKKGLDLGALIKAGIDVADVDKDDLRDYLEEDVLAVESVFTAFETYGVPDELDMNYILPLAKMELNGLPIDQAKTRKLIEEQEKLKNKAAADVEDMILVLCEYADGSPITRGGFKPLAPRTMSYYLTGYPEHGCGGSAKDKSSKQIVFKAGQEPLLDAKAIVDVWGRKEPNPNLGYPINASVIEILTRTSSVMNQYKKAKDANKLLNTYLYPFLQEARVTGGTVHPKLNTCSTNTGRLSSSNPNGQNMPPIVRSIIKSTEGEMYEIDFAQLEMIGAATLSGDVQMRQDIRNGMDIHYQTGKSVFGWKTESDMTKDTRRTVKGVNFGLLYGGGAAGISENTGADKKTVKELIAAFYARYPVVGAWQEKVLRDVEVWATVMGTKNGESYKGSTIQLPSIYGGRRFYFEESESPRWKQHQDGCKHSFKPTETKNYPIQGFAGGDIVMRALSVLDDVLAGTSVVLRMTVHDSIVLDWKAGKEEDLHKIMTKVCEIVESKLGIPVPLKFDIDHDVYWL